MPVFITFVTMKALLITLLCLIIGLNNSAAQTKRALVVGVGDYPAESGWGKIHGDNDILIVKETLAYLNFDNKNITVLVNNEATKSNIISHLNGIATKAKSGDIVYIHFSGHGQRVSDINGDETDDKYDESIIPYDAKKQYKKDVYEGENHILDDEFNLYLNKIASTIGRSGTLCVVLDACHSGGATRDEEVELFTRGSKDIFTIPHNAINKQHIPSTELSWVEISACKSYQTNYECRVNDEYFGSLSYALFKLVTESKNGDRIITIDLLKDQLNTLLQSKNIIQTPTITMPEWAKYLYLL